MARRLASASDDKTAKAVGCGQRAGAAHPEGPHHQCDQRGLEPGRQAPASASEDQTAKVWDAASGQELLTLKGHTGPVISVAWSPDGKRLATAS